MKIFSYSSIFDEEIWNYSRSIVLGLHYSRHELDGNISMALLFSHLDLTAAATDSR
jgi:hypothetical protein